jgi:hypothetical protein
VAGTVDVHARWRVVIEFHTAESSSPTEIHIGLRSMFGEDAICVSSVRRVCHFKGGENNFVNRLCSASAKGSMQPAQCVPHKGGKNVVIINGTV